MIAIAFGVEGPTIVWWKLSNSTKFFAQAHMNGIVSQSIVAQIGLGLLLGRRADRRLAVLRRPVTICPHRPLGRQAFLVHRIAIVLGDLLDKSMPFAMPWCA